MLPLNGKVAALGNQALEADAARLLTVADGSCQSAQSQRAATNKAVRFPLSCVKNRRAVLAVGEIRGLSSSRFWAAGWGSPQSMGTRRMCGGQTRRTRRVSGQMNWPDRPRNLRAQLLSVAAPTWLLTRVTDATQLYAVRVYARFCVKRDLHGRRAAERATRTARAASIRAQQWTTSC